MNGFFAIVSGALLIRLLLIPVIRAWRDEDSRNRLEQPADHHRDT